MTDFPEIFRTATGTEWSDDYAPFRKIAELRFAEDKCLLREEFREMMEVHYTAVAYYTMYLVSLGKTAGGAKLSESLGDYSYSKSAGRYDGLNEWLGKYLSFLDGFRVPYMGGVPLPQPHPMTWFDAWRGHRR